MPADRTGILFSNHLARSSAQVNRLLEDGSGVAAGDVDGDGLCDLYFCRLDGPNALYKNLGGWRFQDVTGASGAACSNQYSTGAALADLDGDNDLDLIVNATGRGTRCFLNDGNGRFSEPANPELATRTGARSMALADIDGDGDLDLYVTHYRAATAKDAPVPVRLRQIDGRWQVPQEHQERFVAEVNASGNVGILELGEPDALYINDGKARFTLASWTEGRFVDEEGKPLNAPPRDWGLAAMFRDINQDGFPDLYVCNDFYTPDRIWINRSNGTFRAFGALAIRKTPWASMAVDFSDINRDGLDEIFVAEMLSRELERRQTHRSLSELDPMPSWGWGCRPGDLSSRSQVMRNTLLLNRGDNTFAEIGQFSGVHASDWTWGVTFLDVDLDGYEDLLIANGHSLDLADSDSVAVLNQIKDPNDPRRRTRIHEVFKPLHVAKNAFRNRGDLMFQEVGEQWNFNEASAANGMALADLDNDGDMDVVLNNFDAPASILQNQAAAPRIAIRLRGNGGNPSGIGARITVTGGPVKQSQEMIAGGRYLSSDDAIRSFAASSQTNLLGVEVLWRSGRRSELKGVSANHIYEVAESAAGSPKAPAGSSPIPTPRPWFQDDTAKLNHLHIDQVDDDGSAQPLLPRRISSPGPGLGWLDINSDGHDDLVIPSGRGGRLGVFLGNGRGGFQAMSAGAWSDIAAMGQTAVMGWSPEPQAFLLWVGHAAFCGSAITNKISRTHIWPGGIDPLPPIDGLLATLGALAAADVEGDGDLDVFVGGRAIPGRYPESAPSVLLMAEGHRWTQEPAASGAWQDMGLVTSAVWSDLDNDGSPELVVACEWSSLRVWKRQGGQWLELTKSLGLDRFRGWWQSVSTGDFDGDGRLDIVAGNWGLNNKYHEFIEGGVRLFHGDVDSNGTYDVIEAVLDPRRGRVVPFRDRRTLSRAMPHLNGLFADYRGFAKAGLTDILPAGSPAIPELRVDTLASMVFLNRGGQFIPRVLPAEAQFSPAMGIAVADFDGDGREDLFVSQNFSALDPETSREDAGRSLLLRGEGDGRFTPIGGQDSGLMIYGEQRGCAVADYDADGRPDLAVAQPGGPTRLFRNQAARPGVRVRFDGPLGNVSSVGAKLRVAPSPDVPLGPARVIRAGSGCGSQDSVVQVVNFQGGVARLWIQWPGGKVEEFSVPTNTAEVLVSPSKKPRFTPRSR